MRTNTRFLKSAKRPELLIFESKLFHLIRNERMKKFLDTPEFLIIGKALNVLFGQISLPVYFYNIRSDIRRPPLLMDSDNFNQLSPTIPLSPLTIRYSRVIMLNI